jgi:hypothetical protein
MIISSEDKNFISNFPSLKFENGDRLLVGELSFVARYNKKSSKRYVIYDKYSSVIEDKYLICDSYDIEIDLFSVNIYRSVRETGRKIEKTAEIRKVTFDYLHYYKDTQKVCVFGYLDEKQDIGLKEFLGEVVIPFFYDQSFYCKYGKWPRGTYSHGCLGILENYYDNIKNKRIDKNISTKCINVLKELSSNRSNETDFKNIIHLLHKKKIKPHWNCVHCGYEKIKGLTERRRHRKPKVSNFNLCHREAYKGLKYLQKNIKEFKLTI